MIIRMFHLALLLLALALPARAQVLLKEPPAEIRGLEVEERLGETIPLDLIFTDSDARPAPLSKYFHQGRPVVLVLGYYNCPLVCPLILERLLGALNQVDYTLGRDFQVVVISFDPRNTPAMAAANKKQYLAGYRRGVTPEAEAGWAFHTSDEASVKRLADAIGFEYRFIKESGEYSHPVALTFLSPQGKVTRYVYGFDYEPRTFKLSLLEASSGSIARSVGDRFLWFCYHYDPKTGKYTLAAFRVMQLGALLVLCGVAGMVIVLRLGELRRARKANESAAPAGGVTAAGQSA